MSAGVFNPTEVERSIRGVSNQISENVAEVDRCYREFQQAEHRYDLAFARAYMGHRGPAHEKRYSAELATEEERRDRDVKEAAFKYAERRWKALDAELRSWQSVGASVRAMYSVAGV